MLKNKRHRIILCLLSFSILVFLIACGDPDTKIDRNKLVKSNALNTVMEKHSSVMETVKYYETLDNKATYGTTSYYTKENNGVYILSGFDMRSRTPAPLMGSPTDESHFQTYIANDTEYHYLTDTGTMTVYPLTSKYMPDLLADSFVIDSTSKEAITSINYQKDQTIIITEADINNFFKEETLAKMEELAGKKLKAVRYVYFAEKDDLLLNAVNTYYIATDNSKYLFSEAEISYDISDENKPSTSFVDDYLSAAKTRTITVTEKVDSFVNIKQYTFPASISPDFRCFEVLYDYTIYTDENFSVKYNSEKPDAEGNYPDANFYALSNKPNADASDTKKP